MTATTKSPYETRKSLKVQIVNQSTKGKCIHGEANVDGLLIHFGYYAPEGSFTSSSLLTEDACKFGFLGKNWMYHVLQMIAKNL